MNLKNTVIMVIAALGFSSALMAQPLNTPHIYHYLYGLSGYQFDDLANAYSAKLMVVDVDDAELTSPQIAALKQNGTTVYSYLSIGEAENYRDYWQGWSEQKPDFLLAENKEWKGNYRVKFWDKDWQNIIIAKAQKIAQIGFSGVYLDIIDGYQVKQVINAYSGSTKELRAEMENFIIRISAATKAINPNFKIIPQNAVELTAAEGSETQPNRAYLKAIDGLGVEDLWFNDDEISDWTEGDLKYIKLAQAKGKFILVTSYPTKEKYQAEFLSNARKNGFIPFVGKRDLSKKSNVYSINRNVQP